MASAAIQFAAKPIRGKYSLLQSPCLCSCSVMHAEATAATPAYNPADKPGRFARVLDVVRKLIDYGKALAEAVHQRTEKIDFAARACNFGTNDIELIIARITRGLLRAR